MADHVAHTGLVPVVGIVLTQVADHLPVLRVQSQALAFGLCLGESFRPFGRVDQIALAVGQYAAAVDFDQAGRHVGIGVAARRELTGGAGRIEFGLRDRPQVHEDLAIEAAVETLDAGNQDLAAACRQFEVRDTAAVGEHRRRLRAVCIHPQHHRRPFQRFAGNLHFYPDRDHCLSPCL